MSLLYRVIYATHANGTHHKLALDALQRLTRADTDAWQRLFLKHVEIYLDGAKAPDTTFKDFKNHVLHVRDGYWGGAPEKVVSWYRHLVSALGERNWPEAVWCAGVLSHYYTDPIHPFHTAQSEAENNIHRAVEWSISRDYDNLKREAEALSRSRFVEAPNGADWLKDFVLQGADRANAHYERLIAHYDFTTGVVDPPAGLDPVARDLIGDLILFAADGYARVLERAIAEAGVAPPTVSLSVETVLATLKIPLKWVQKKLADAEDRRVVEAMYDELMATGRVEAALPEDDRAVRDVWAREVLAPRTQKQARRRAARLPATAAPVARPQATARLPAAPAGGAIAAGTGTAAGAPQRPRGIAPVANRTTETLAGPPPDVPLPDMTSAPRLVAYGRHAEPRDARIYLAADDDVERAPSIGPRTAERLYAVDIATVKDLLAADPVQLRERLATRHITTQTITDWQDQSRLVMTVPGLRGTHAQLLVAAGYRTPSVIGDADPIELSASLLKVASTAEGQRFLRDGPAPDLERIRSWIEQARRARAA